MIQSVRLQRQHALFLPSCRLFVFVWRFTRPVSVPRCFSALPHKFGPAAVAVELLKLTAAPLFLTARSFIIVSSSGPLGLMFSNKPLYLETFWVDAFAIYSLYGPKRRPVAPWSTKTDQLWDGMWCLGNIFCGRHFLRRLLDYGDNPPIYSPHALLFTAFTLRLPLPINSRLAARDFLHFLLTILSVRNICQTRD